MRLRITRAATRGALLGAAILLTTAPEIRAARVSAAADGVRIKTATAEFLLEPSSAVKVWLFKDGGRVTLDDPAPSGTPSDGLVVGGQRSADIALDVERARTSEAHGKLGSGTRVEVSGRSPSGIEKTLAMEAYDDFPGVLFVSASYRNMSASPLAIDTVELLSRRLVAPEGTSLWSFQGASEEWGRDEILRVAPGLERQNPTGTMTPGGFGGGIPVVAFWSASVGEAIGQVETIPIPLSLPVKAEAGGRVRAALSIPVAATLRPGESYATPRAFVAVYSGDYYEPLRTFSTAVQREGWTLPKPSRAAYDVAWCGWGYESDVTPAQMLAIVPKLKEMGIRWATLDDRWFDTYGDWRPRGDTFPGDAIRKLAEEYHRQGIFAQLWWLPLGVEDGRGKYESHSYGFSVVAREHPDWLVLGKDGQPARITRGLATLCPALPEVKEYHRMLTERFVRDWGFDGHKLDNIYAIPPCYNPKHHHARPAESTEAMGEIYRTIFETTRSLKPESVTQICPCGTTPSFDWLRQMDQAVTADPVGSVQVRRRLKLYKALLGPEAPVYGDHVELTGVTAGPQGPEVNDDGEDFASTIGVGGVPGTKFILPGGGDHFRHVALTPRKEAIWKKWLRLYDEKRLSSGTLVNLYTYGFDVPEAYAIRKDGRLHYAFFAPEGGGAWKGDVELRGLAPGRYRVVDYVNGSELGTIDAAHPRLSVEIRDSLLLQADKVP
jgi:alpha-galactosidase